MSYFYMEIYKKFTTKKSLNKILINLFSVGLITLTLIIFSTVYVIVQFLLVLLSGLLPQIIYIKYQDTIDDYLRHILQRDDNQSRNFSASGVPRSLKSVDDLSESEKEILKILEESDESLTTNEIAKRLNKDQKEMNHLLNDLWKNRFIFKPGIEEVYHSVKYIECKKKRN